LRWLFAATLVAWTVAVLCGASSPSSYASEVAGTGILAAFMAAVGVRTSLSATTATRAMAITIGVWLGARILVAILAAIVIGLTLLLISITLSLASLGSFVPPRWLFTG